MEKQEVTAQARPGPEMQGGLRLAVAGGVFLVLFAAYLSAMAPDVTFHDSGELISGAWCLGIPHPPGSPTWCLLAHPFSWIPFGSPGFRINVSSGFFGALTCAGIYLLAARLMARGSASVAGFWRHAGAVGGAIILGTAPAFWEKSVQTEIYTLNACFLAALLYLFEVWADRAELGERNHRRILAWIAFLFGIGSGNYLALLYYVPIFAAAALWIQPKLLKDWRLMLGMGAAFLIGFSVYVYLPVRSLANPPMDWGNPETWPSFLKVMRRERWGRFTIGPDFWSFMRVWLGTYYFPRELGWAGILAALAGLFWLGRRRAWSCFVLVGCFYIYAAAMSVMQAATPALSLIYVESYGMEEFHIPLYEVLAAFIAVGLGVGLERLRGFWKRRALGWGGDLCLAAGLAAVLVLPAALRFGRLNFRHYLQPAAYGRALAQSVRRGGWIIPFSDDSTFVLAYLKICRNERPDLGIITPSTALRNDLEQLGSNADPTNAARTLIRLIRSHPSEAIEPILNQPGMLQSAPTDLALCRPPSNDKSALLFRPEGWVFRPGPAMPDTEKRQDLFWRQTLAQPEFSLQTGSKADFRENMMSVLTTHARWHALAKEPLLAARLYLKAAEYAPIPRLDLRTRAAIENLEGGAAQAAYDEAREVLAKEPTNIEAWETEGAACVGQGNLQGAIECFQTILSLDPSDKRAQANLSRARQAWKKQHGSQP